MPDEVFLLSTGSHSFHSAAHSAAHSGDGVGSPLGVHIGLETCSTGSFLSVKTPGSAEIEIIHEYQTKAVPSLLRATACREGHPISLIPGHAYRRRGGATLLDDLELSVTGDFGILPPPARGAYVSGVVTVYSPRSGVVLDELEMYGSVTPGMGPSGRALYTVCGYVCAQGTRYGDRVGHVPIEIAIEGMGVSGTLMDDALCGSADGCGKFADAYHAARARPGQEAARRAAAAAAVLAPVPSPPPPPVSDASAFPDVRNGLGGGKKNKKRKTHIALVRRVFPPKNAPPLGVVGGVDLDGGARACETKNGRGRGRGRGRKKRKRNSRAVRRKCGEGAVNKLIVPLDFLPGVLPGGVLSPASRAMIARMCPHFLAGYCAFGTRCRHSHDLRPIIHAS